MHTLFKPLGHGDIEKDFVTQYICCLARGGLNPKMAGNKLAKRQIPITRY